MAQKESKTGGPGSKQTVLAESLQCYACSARKAKRKPLKDINDVIKRPGNHAKTPVTLNTAINNLDESWYYSSIAIANQLFVDFPELDNADYSFHHNTGVIQTRITAEFNRLKGNSVLNNVNKWNPADMWVVKNTFSVKTGFKTLGDLNDYLLENFQKRNLIGVSLKKIGMNEPAHMDVYNTGQSSRAKFSSYVVSNEITDAKNVAIEFFVGKKPGKITLRTFNTAGTTWGGEIDGTYARGGKVMSTALFEAARETHLNPSLVVTPSKVSSFVNRPKESDFKKLAEMWKVIANDTRPVKTLVNIITEKYKEDKVWFKSLYLSVAFCYAMFMSNKENEVINWMYHYASSQSKESSVFVKYSSE